MYLMSLVEQARPPFSLVDEINQGMDQNYERAVHNSLVEVTCAPDAGQYFLITPKLLTDLNYHDRMKVLCVCNGEWLPEAEPQKPVSGSLMAMIDAVVAHRAKR
jgi:structural maintenance of chromosomes protein 5